MSDSVIWKHDLGDSIVTTIALPAGAEVLHVAVQDESIRLWERHPSIVTTTERRTFRIAGTGHPFPANAGQRHIGTVLSPSGTFVWHVFEETGGAR